MRTYKGHKMIMTDERSTFINGKELRIIRLTSGQYSSSKWYNPHFHLFHSWVAAKEFINECIRIEADNNQQRETQTCKSI